MTVDEILAHIREHTGLEAETEHDVIEEIRAHLEEAVEAAQARGLDEHTALAEAAARFGVDEVGPALQAAHAGWGTADGVIAAALPVICALVLRWVVFRWYSCWLAGSAGTASFLGRFCGPASGPSSPVFALAVCGGWLGCLLDPVGGVRGLACTPLVEGLLPSGRKNVE